MLKELILTFSKYSVFPMPEIKQQKHDICTAAFLPLVGLVIAACIGICLYFFPVFHFSRFFISAVTLLLPLMITGGIHFNGWLHTFAAFSCRGSKEEQQQLLTQTTIDTSCLCSAFLYVFSCFIIWYDLYPFLTTNTAVDMTLICLIMLIYVMSRCFCSLLMLTLPDIQHTTNEAPAKIKKYKFFVLTILFLCCVLAFILDPRLSGILFGAGVIFFFYARLKILKFFSGITEQIAGWFLQHCELLFLAALLIGCKWYY